MRSRNRLPIFLWILLCACLLTASASLAADGINNGETACGPDERAAFLEAANNGVPPAVLHQQFAHCADSATTSLATPGDKIITVNNALASTFYEQMNGCGYHPQIGVAACDVEIKQTFGFGPFGPPPFGSTEFVDFCFFCGGGVFPVQGTVHVTDDTTGVVPSWGMMAFAPIPNVCGFPAGTGAPFTIRATLSWGAPATNPCTATPTMTWGNQITFDTRDDP